MCGLVLGLAGLLRDFCVFDLGVFSHPGIAEHRQEDGPSSWCEPMGDPDGGTVECRA
jgi:hypothetical protein